MHCAVSLSGERHKTGGVGQSEQGDVSGVGRRAGNLAAVDHAFVAAAGGDDGDELRYCCQCTSIVAVAKIENLVT